MTTASTPLLIGGQERPGGHGTFPVADPARRGAVVGHAAAASAADAEAAVWAAEQAWPAWAALPAAERIAITLKALDGGNDPAIILDDADLDEAAFGRLSAATFMTSGQVCMAVKRLYVPRRRYDEVVDGLRATLEPTRVGPGLDPDTTMGPLNTERQRDYVAGLCEQARGAGAEVLTFGEYASDADGNYLLPALVLDPAAHLNIVAEEQFGPALPVIPYDSEAEAVALANQTWSGLCSSVWSADAEHAMTIGGQLRTGVTFFNNHNATAVDERAPFGGFNASGIGRELGRQGLHEFTETHVMAVPSDG